MATPFHLVMKVCHHMRSERIAALRRMWWCFLLVPFNSSNTLLRNVLPRHTTLQACCSLPARDWSSRLEQDFLTSHEAIKTRSFSSFFCGRRSGIDLDPQEDDYRGTLCLLDCHWDAQVIEYR